MWHKPAKNQAVSPIRMSRTMRKQPKPDFLTAVNVLAESVPSINAFFDKNGDLRTLTTNDGAPLYSKPLVGSTGQHASKFLAEDAIQGALGLSKVTLGRAVESELPGLGYCVNFPQEVITEEMVRYRVRESSVQVFIKPNGEVFNLNSTLCHQTPNLELDGIITEDEAIEAAKKELGKLKFDDNASAELVFSGYKERLDPVYEVKVSANSPRQAWLVLVTAHDGEVVYKRSLVKYSNPKRALSKPACGAAKRPQTKGSPLGKLAGKPSRRPRQGGSGSTNSPKAKVLLRIPDPKTAIGKQISDVVLEQLPDTKVLKNDNLVMYVGSKKTPVKAMADGTYNYPVNSGEFCAVVVFFALNAQIELMKKWGLKTPAQPIPVVVEDRTVKDNAYFDPSVPDAHIGVGTGLSSGGLNRYIAYDLGVEWHEFGHYFVFLQTPGNDLPGDEGGAIHESIGDVLGDLLMDWWFRYTFAKQLGTTLTLADIEADRRVIGMYALPPDGIRIQKNKKKAPGDKTGEPHDDGLISGGAKADLLVAMVKKYDIPQGLENFGRLTLAALALVPSHRVTFRDLLNAYVTADNNLNKGANKDLITKAFNDHGIKLTTSRKRKGSKVPVIIISEAL